MKGNTKKFKPRPQDILDAISLHRGNIAAIARTFNVTRETVYNYLRSNTSAMRELEKCREVAYEELLDSAEHVMRFSLASIKDKPRLAFDAAKFVLEKKGHARNWSKEKEESSKEENLSNQIQELIDKI